MDPSSSPAALPGPVSLRERNKLRLRNQIIEAAVALTTARGIEAVSADDIAAAAEVGRATFFRYFDSKEAAVIAAFYERRLAVFEQTLRAAPARLDPMETMAWTLQRLAAHYQEQQDMIFRLDSMLRGSAALRARALEFQGRYEDLIVEAVSPRFRKLKPNDLRPRLLATASMSVIRAVLQVWVDGGRNIELPELIRQALQQVKSGFSSGR